MGIIDGSSGLPAFLLHLLLVFAFALSTAAAQDANTNRITYEGTLGTAHIGLTVLVKSGNALSGGHYFYAKYLTDIPLTGSVQGAGLTLQGQDGGTFALKFKGNGSEGGKPLNFENTVGLEGSWSKDGKSLPVSLTLVTSAPAGERWYENVTDQSDKAFEATAQGFYKAVLTDDQTAAAKYVAFPLRVNSHGKSRTIATASELSTQWKTIFTPAYLAQLRMHAPHDMSVVKGEAMLGPGLVWFSDKGATSLNLP